MANITQAKVANGIPTIVAAEALGYLKANTVLAQLVNRDYSSEVATYGNIVDIPFTGALSVNDKAADTAVTLQTPADSKVSVTLNKHKEVSFLIEDIATALARPDYLSAYVADAMAVVAEQIDTDIAALYSGFSQTIDATTGLGEDDFRNARRLLTSAKAPLRNRVAVLHEDAEYELLGIEKFVNQDYKLQGAPEALIGSYVGKFLGFDVFTDQNIPVATAVAKNLFFHKDAIVLATRPLPAAPAGSGVQQAVMGEDGIGLRATMSYSADNLGVQMTIDVLYGVAELRDNHGVVVSTTEI